MIVHKDVIQGTPEWHELRKGKMTGMHGAAIGNYGKGLETYCRKVVRGMFIEEPPGYVSKDMERGNELEPIARQVLRI